MGEYSLPQYYRPLPRGAEASVKQLDKSMEDLREMGKQPNFFTEKTLFKEFIDDIDYTPILYLLYMMKLTANIDQVHVKISNCG